MELLEDLAKYTCPSYINSVVARKHALLPTLQSPRGGVKRHPKFEIWAVTKFWMMLDPPPQNAIQSLKHMNPTCHPKFDPKTKTDAEYSPRPRKTTEHILDSILDWFLDWFLDLLLDCFLD